MNKIEKEKAIADLRHAAQERIIKSEMMRFRLEEPTYRRLLSTAMKLKKRSSTLVREWVVEKLDEIERNGSATPGITAIGILTDSLAEQGLLKNAQVRRIQKLLKDSMHV
jgi:hypothetical protein